MKPVKIFGFVLVGDVVPDRPYALIHDWLPPVAEILKLHVGDTADHGYASATHAVTHPAPTTLTQVGRAHRQ